MTSPPTASPRLSSPHLTMSTRSRSSASASASAGIRSQSHVSGSSSGPGRDFRTLCFASDSPLERVLYEQNYLTHQSRLSDIRPTISTIDQVTRNDELIQRMRMNRRINPIKEYAQHEIHRLNQVMVQRLTAITNSSSLTYQEQHAARRHEKAGNTLRVRQSELERIERSNYILASRLLENKPQHLLSAQHLSADFAIHEKRLRNMSKQRIIQMKTAPPGTLIQRYKAGKVKLAKEREAEIIHNKQRADQEQKSKDNEHEHKHQLEQMQLHMQNMMHTQHQRHRQPNDNEPADMTLEEATTDNRYVQLKAAASAASAAASNHANFTGQRSKPTYETTSSPNVIDNDSKSSNQSQSQLQSPAPLNSADHANAMAIALASPVASTLTSAANAASVTSPNVQAEAANFLRQSDQLMRQLQFEPHSKQSQSENLPMKNKSIDAGAHHDDHSINETAHSINAEQAAISASASAPAQPIAMYNHEQRQQQQSARSSNTHTSAKSTARTHKQTTNANDHVHPHKANHHATTNARSVMAKSARPVGHGPSRHSNNHSANSSGSATAATSVRTSINANGIVLTAAPGTRPSLQHLVRETASRLPAPAIAQLDSLVIVPEMQLTESGDYQLAWRSA